MTDMIENDFCEKVPLYDINKPIWYIPHYGVYHRVKKKIRVVFDCSAKHNGRSLNDSLLTGPDLINSLLGILLRFRKEQVAFQCDITKMFPNSKYSRISVICCVSCGGMKATRLDLLRITD